MATIASQAVPGSADLSPVARRALRAVTLRVVIFLIVCYFVAYLDRVNVGFAALTMNHDLGLTATMYGWGAGLLFVGYFAFGVPSNIMLERLGARVWIAILMISWGLVSMLTAFVTGPLSFYAARFLLGLAEAGFYPGVIIFLTQWFPSEHRGKIISIFSVASPISSFLGSPVSGALLDINGVLGLAGWQWLFIIEAAPAVLLGIATFYILPNRPSEARWLTAEEQVWLESRLEVDRRRRAAAPPSPPWWQVMFAPQVLVLGLIYSGSTVATYGLTLWLPQIIKTFGLTNFQTGIVAAIPWGVAAVGMIWWGHRSDRAGERVWHTAATLIATALGLGASLVLRSPIPVMIAMCVAATGAHAIKGPFWPYVTSSLPPATVAAAVAAINSLGNLGGFFGPFLIGWVKDRTNSYEYAMAPLIAFSLIGAGIMLAMKPRPGVAVP